MSTQNKFRADIPDYTPTPPDVFFNRRRFVKAMMASGVVGPAACAQIGQSSTTQDDDTEILTPPFERPDIFPAVKNKEYTIPDSIKNHELTPRKVAASHNNFYEFLPNRGGPVYKYTKDYKVQPWEVEITGECNNPKTFTLDDLFNIEHEERLYHFRCVERWAMNVPWTGFALHKLIKKVEPTNKAKYIRFESANKPNEMPGIKSAQHYEWPYHEALRMDEAMHDLCFVATGVYGKPLLKQHGSPLRITVPWKYGYKNPKAIVKIELVSEEPQTFWRSSQPHEYGFISNVNPNIPHPRWSQAESYWLDTRARFETPIFNGYGSYVASLYPDEPRTLQKPLTRGQTAR